jgi:hypothetical protein
MSFPRVYFLVDWIDHTVLSEFRTRLVASTAEALVASQTAYQVELVGPIAKDYRGPGTRTERLCPNRFLD